MCHALVAAVTLVIRALVTDLDFSHLTLHQAKRSEMESQVRVLELESDLDRERQRLGELRKTHYRMAGESEGWEQQVSAPGR